MSIDLRNAGDLRRARRLAVALSLTAITLAGCGGRDGEDRTASAPTTSLRESAADSEAVPILIKTRVNIPTGKVLAGSTIGESSFCPGGTFKDKHGAYDIGLVERTMSCKDGTLRMGLDPQMPVGDAQRGPWRIISGTGAYAGWGGSGEMVIRYDPGDTPQHPTRGRERYTGTVSHQG